MHNSFLHKTSPQVELVTSYHQILNPLETISF